MENIRLTTVLFVLLSMTINIQGEAFSPTEAISTETTHNWSQGRIMQKATCTTAGMAKYVCLDPQCGEVKYETITPLGHDYFLDFITDLMPTCTATGSKSKHCSRCSEKDEITEIPANGHKWNQGEIAIPSTCTEGGAILYECVISGCDATRGEIIPARGHHWDAGEIIQEATCTTKGIKQFSCINEDCNALQREYAQALGHEFVNQFTIDRPADCIHSGEKSRHCSRCEERINITMIEAVGHDWNMAEIIQPATCTQNGSCVLSCKNSNCTVQITQEILLIGHNYTANYVVDKEPTCDQEGSKSRHCSRCDAHNESIAIPAIGHTPGDTLTDRIITACCHNPGQYDEVCYCTICAKETYRKTIVTPIKEHNWDNGKITIYPTKDNKGKRVYTCTECRITRFEIIDKLHEEIILLPNEEGDVLRVSKEGFCPGTENHIKYYVKQGTPVEYKLDFDEAALAEGFTPQDWSEVSEDSKIKFIVPEDCQGGKYTATITFKDETGEETTPMNIVFRVNLSSQLMVAIFDDVVSIDNRGNQFSSFQWYHNGREITGANKPYFQEMGGLTGNYFVRLNIGGENETRTCAKSDWEKAIETKKELLVSPNPMEEETLLTLKNFNDDTHHISVINEVGSTVLLSTFKGEEHMLNVSQFASGKYFINVDGTVAKAIKK